MGAAPTLKMLKCSETLGITSSSTAKCNIPTVPEVSAPAGGAPFLGGAPWFYILFSLCLLLHFGKDFGTILDALWGIIFIKTLRNNGSSAA